MRRIGPKGKERNCCGMGMKGARVTDRLQFPLSRVSRCNIYCRAVLQLDMKHCGFYSFFARPCVLSINWITYASCIVLAFSVLAFSSNCVFSAPSSPERRILGLKCTVVNVHYGTPIGNPTLKVSMAAQPPEVAETGAYWPLTADLLLKFRIFKNPRWRRPPVTGWVG